MGRWLSRRCEYGQKHTEWEEFYHNNSELVPNLVGDVESLRETMFKVKMRGQQNSVPITEGLSVHDSVITSENGIGIPIRIYTPHGQTEGLLIMIYFHGGGWALGDLDGEDRTCRSLCVAIKMVVVSVDYRLAPEYPYPAALHDAWATLKWVLANPAIYDFKINKLFAGGTSAGANLAAILCHQAKLHGITIHGQLLRIPVLCQSEPHYRGLGLESMDIFHDSPILCRQSMVQFLDWYNPPDASDISVSPLLATDSDFSFLPPTYMQVCGQDPLRDEGLAYADRLEECGIPVKIDVYTGLPHAFWVFPEISTTTEAGKHLLDGVNWLLKATQGIVDTVGTISLKN